MNKFPIKLFGGNRSEVTRALLTGCLSTFLLSTGFIVNLWQVAEQGWFAGHQYDMESHIVGRMVKSRQDGILSDGGLTGLGSPTATPVAFSDHPFTFQYKAYIDGLPFRAYTTYLSQIGAQGMFFSLLDRMVPLPRREKLRAFRALTSLLTAVSLTGVVLWFYSEFGLCTASFVLGSAVFSQWLVVFGRNLWWSMWAFYLPMVVLMYYSKHSRSLNLGRFFGLGAIVFTTMLIKLLFNGYEFITTSIIMMVVPLVYFGALQKWSLQFSSRVFLTTIISICLAVLVSFVILCSQIAAVGGDGVDHIVGSFQKRTHADPDKFPPEYGLESRTIPVLVQYLKGTYLDLNNYLSVSNEFVSRFLFKVRYVYLILFFLFMSIGLYFLRAKGESGRSAFALISATWFSILAPLSWFIVFKSHSHTHTHMDYIVWQMPYTLFGFAICGLVAKMIYLDLESRKVKVRSRRLTSTTQAVN